KGSRWTASWRGSFRSGHVRRGGGAVVHRALALGSIRMCPVIRHLVPGLFLSTAFPAAAQLPIVDIAAVPVGGQVEVRVRPDAGFNGLFSSIVFTLKWPEADGASLGSVTQQSPVTLYCGVSRSGGEQVDGGYRYQVFVGFGNIPLVDPAT